MAAFDGEIVSFIGRLDAFPRFLAHRAVIASGGVVRRGLSRRTSMCVVGHGAFQRIAQLEKRLEIGRQNGPSFLSENQFLRRAGIMLPANPDQRTFGVEDIISRSGLAPAELRLLVLLDIIQPSDDRFGMRDLLLAKSICALLRDGLAIVDIVRELAAARESLNRIPPNLFGDEAGRVTVRLGQAIAEISGQLRLPLTTPDDGSVDALFEEAEEAEDLGDWRKAERLYRRCVDRDRKDPAAAYNLGNVLCRLGQQREGRLWLLYAVGIDPDFAEAWYNLAVVAHAQGRREEACQHLKRALAIDPGFADAMFNLAVFRFEAGEHGAAEALWQRYLEYDAKSEWARRARCGLALCRGLALSEGRRERSLVLGNAPQAKSSSTCPDSPPQ